MEAALGIVARIRRLQDIFPSAEMSATKDAIHWPRSAQVTVRVKRS